jgi:dienelactone hydrolase
MGGFTVVALGAREIPGVLGYINFSGGVAGDPTRAPGRSCGAKEMETVMARFGTTTKVPNLWLYAENDRYWGPEAPRAWHAAFKAGGSPTTFVQTGPVPDTDGHQLLPRGGPLWSVHTDRFVRGLGLP